MAEGRMLKRVISTSPRLAALKNDTHRLIYTWLIPYLDVEGRIEADPRIIKGHVCPLLDHITTKIIDTALVDMAANDLIILYYVNTNKYLQLQRFDKHQNIRKDRERGSDIPDPNSDNSRITPGQLPEAAGITPTQEKLREDNINKGGPPEQLPEWIPKEQWNGFVFMRKEIKKPLTGRAIKIAISTLLDLKNKGHDPGRVLDQSTMGKWQGLFELKTGGNGNGTDKRGHSAGGPRIPEYTGEHAEISPTERAENVKRIQQLTRTIGSVPS
jgi:hypothetical protein